MSEIIKKEKHTAKFDRMANEIMKQGQNGAITVPVGYSVANAVKGAYLAIKEVEDKAKRAALDVCSDESLYMSLLKMVVLGLNPLTGQCYFSVYGDKLSCGLEYTANIMVAKRDCGMIGQPIFDVIRDGEEYEVGRDDMGRKYLLKHKSDFKSKSGEIIGAYCRINLPDGDFVFKDYSIEQMRRSWLQGYKGKQLGDVHKNFEEEMCAKTVINKTLSRIVKSATNMPKLFSDDDYTETTIDTSYEEVKQEKISLPVAGKNETINIENPEKVKEETKKQEVKQVKQQAMDLQPDMSQFD